MKAPRILLKILIMFSFSYSTVLWAQNIGVVDIQKVFDGYHKVKEARERLNNSRKIAKEEIGIFREELAAIVKELKETEAKMKNPNIDSSALRETYQAQIKKAREKQDDLVQYEKRTTATIAQRQSNLLKEHIADIREAVGKVAQAKKMDLVLNSAQTQLGVFYATSTLDLTEQVVATLNSGAPKK